MHESESSPEFSRAHLHYQHYREAADISPQELASLVEAYRAVFSRPPWNEAWASDDVEQKLSREVTGPDSFLALALNERNDVEAFCWGNIIAREDIPARFQAAHKLEDESVLAALPSLVDEQVLYIDEIGKVPFLQENDTGIESILNLGWPIVAKVQDGDVGVLCWSGKGSKIIPILEGAFGFDEIATIGDIKFYYVPKERARETAEKVSEQFGALVKDRNHN